MLTSNRLARYLFALSMVGSTAFITPFANAQTKDKNFLPEPLSQELSSPAYQTTFDADDFTNGEEPIALGEKRCTRWSKKRRRFCVKRIAAFNWKWGWEYR